MQDKTMSSPQITVQGFGDNAELVSENNKSNKFYWMDNKFGRTVPVPIHLEQSKLKAGFRHIDGKVVSEDLNLRIKPVFKDTPMEQMAKAMESNAAVLAEVAGAKKNAKSKVEEPSKSKV